MKNEFDRPSMHSSFDAMLRQNQDAFVKSFWDDEEEHCLCGDGPCSFTFFEAWLKNGWTFFLDAAARLEYIQARRRGESGDHPLEELETSLTEYVLAFTLYCERANLKLDQALAMLPGLWRQRFLSEIKEFDNRTPAVQKKALALVNTHFMDTFERSVKGYEIELA